MIIAVFTVCPGKFLVKYVDWLGPRLSCGSLKIESHDNFLVRLLFLMQFISISNEYYSKTGSVFLTKAAFKLRLGKVFINKN